MAIKPSQITRSFTAGQELWESSGRIARGRIPSSASFSRIFRRVTPSQRAACARFPFTEQVFPPLSANASLTSAFDQVRDGVAPNEMVGIIFSVPLGRTMERANYRASKQLREQMRLRVKQQEELVMREISDALHTARASLERASLTRRAREFAQQALEAEERKLAGGKSTVFFVLQLQGDLASAKSAELRAKADYNRALSQLAFAEARTLERSRISLELK